MAASTAIVSTPVWRLMRLAIWGGAGLLLLFPLIAMQFTQDVQWTPSDFAVMGVLLGLVCGAFEVELRGTKPPLHGGLRRRRREPPDRIAKQRSSEVASGALRMLPLL